MSGTPGMTTWPMLVGEGKVISKELYLAMWRWRQAMAEWAAACASEEGTSEGAIACLGDAPAHLFALASRELPAGGPHEA